MPQGKVSKSGRAACWSVVMVMKWPGGNRSDACDTASAGSPPTVGADRLTRGVVTGLDPMRSIAVSSGTLSCLTSSRPSGWTSIGKSAGARCTRVSAPSGSSGVHALSSDSAAAAICTGDTAWATDVSRSPHSVGPMSACTCQNSILTLAVPSRCHGCVPDSSPWNVTPAIVSPNAFTSIPASMMKTKKKRGDHWNSASSEIHALADTGPRSAVTVTMPPNWMVLDVTAK